jgi:squalene/oxidosqualene cyclase-like protein
MAAYLDNQQHEDGGWGLHIENHSTMFGTVMNYVALRLMGVSAEDPTARRARAWIKENGGAELTPSWGKVWLCVLGVYDYEGVNPVCPDLWALPSNFPVFHPGRMWCHSRMVYLPMGYLYGARVVAPETELVRSLRDEVFAAPYSKVKQDWASLRNKVCPLDIFHPHHWSLDVLHKGLALWERVVPGFVRRYALRESWLQIQREDTWTDYMAIGPVNKMLNMVVAWHAGDETAVQRHFDRIPDYLWVAEDGIKMCGEVGSQCWDTAFSVAALVESGLAGEYPEVLRRAAHFIDHMQMREDMPNKERYYRSGTKGAWPFTTGNHGWAISDCTAEGFTAALLLRDLDFISENRVSAERLYDTVNLLLTDQNPHGGWSSYEPQRGGDWYEMLNPSDVFGKIMVDYPYVECTASVIISFRHFQRQFPAHRRAEMDAAIERGACFIERQQRADGSFYGSWAVCFTYAAWFAIRGLVAAGRDPATHPTIRRAAAFLLSKQREDGGWGEDFLSCETRLYSQARESQVVNTAWATIALIEAGFDEHREHIDRGVGLLMAKQLPDGNFPQEGISGVFNGSCAITYASYRNIFPLWCLGLYANHKKTTQHPKTTKSKKH